MTGPESRPRLFLGSDAEELAREICREADVDPGVLEALVGVEQRLSGKARRHGLFAELERIIDRSRAGRSPA